MSKKLEFKCPICDQPMVVSIGTKVNRKDGVTLWCSTPYGDGPGQCSAQEVAGHGNNEKSAHEVVLQKYKKS